jgi:serine/threonine-protein kinase
LLGDTLPPDRRAVCERHLESCPACQQRLEQLDADTGALVDRVRRFGPASPVRPALAQVLERLHEFPVCPAPAEPAADLSFLRPADRPGLLGTVGDYEVEEILGWGGMGVVLKAFDPRLHRTVAVKVLAPELAASPVARRRFTREARAAAAVRHEHVVTVHAVGEADGFPYLVMQYVPGESLQERLDRTGPLDVAEVVRIGYETARGLAAAHAQGLIHRDVKPANILLAACALASGATPQAAVVKITDFGLARTADDVGLTRRGVVPGTPEYMAPEQVRGEPLDQRSDLFSLGSVLSACCTGTPPFRGANALAVLDAVRTQEPPPLRALNPAVPAGLEALVARLLAKDPADRFQTAAEVAARFEDCLAPRPQPAAPAAPPRRLPLWLAGGLLLVAAGLVLAFLAQVAPVAEPPRPPVLHQDFRGGKEPVAPLRLYGPDANTCTRPEKEGLRLTLPSERPTVEAIGVALNEPVTGDFRITAGYELLQADKATTGYGVGFELWVVTRTPTQEAIALSHVRRPDRADGYMCSRGSSKSGKRTYDIRYTPETATRAQVRITRTGAEAVCWAAAGDGGAFRELCRFDLGTEDLKMVRLSAHTGKAHAGLDLRLLDVTIASDEPIPGVEVAAAPGPGGPPPRGKSWLAATGILGLLLVVGCGVAAWLYRRPRRAAAPAPAPGPVPGDAARPEAEAPPIPVTCPGCGKGLKARAQAAGKKVRCPRCGQPVAVPPAPAGEAGIRTARDAD